MSDPDVVHVYQSYLSLSTLIVNCNGYASPEFVAKYGVPQDFILGPLFFNLYVNDIIIDIPVYYMDCMLMT